MTLSVGQIEKYITVSQAKKRDYQIALTSPAGQRVLQDLAKICYAHESTFDENSQNSSRLEGRREVWLYIQRLLHLSAEQLAEVASGHQFKIVKET